MLIEKNGNTYFLRDQDVKAVEDLTSVQLAALKKIIVMPKDTCRREVGQGTCPADAMIAYAKEHNVVRFVLVDEDGRSCPAPDIAQQCVTVLLFHEYFRERCVSR